MRILIVEDSQTLAEALSQSLQSEGYMPAIQQPMACPR